VVASTTACTGCVLSTCNCHSCGVEPRVQLEGVGARHGVRGAQVVAHEGQFAGEVRQQRRHVGLLLGGEGAGVDLERHRVGVGRDLGPAEIHAARDPVLAAVSRRHRGGVRIPLLHRRAIEHEQGVLQFIEPAAGIALVEEEDALRVHRIQQEAAARARVVVKAQVGALVLARGHAWWGSWPASRRA
jgi:hypothetical protein